MLSWIVLSVAVAYIEVEAGSVVQLSSAQKQAALDQHNTFRNTLGWKDSEGLKFGPILYGYPQNMRKLTWDDQLAQAAQQAADECKRRGHVDLTGTEPTESLMEEYGSIGENIYIKSSGGMNADVSGFVKQWYKEVKNYVWGDQECTKPQGCLAFTQVIWADTETVGCGMAQCVSKKGKKWTNFICQYGPGGNVRGTAPFEVIHDEAQICTGGLTRDPVQTNLCV